MSGPWTTHDGTIECPVHLRDRIEIKQRNGQTFETDFPHSWIGWLHHGQKGHDIVAYRVLSKYNEN